MLEIVLFTQCGTSKKWCTYGIITFARLSTLPSLSLVLLLRVISKGNLPLFFFTHIDRNPWEVIKPSGLFKREFTKFSVAMAEVVAALTLANICLDVQIGICMFLHPSDILTLRKVRQHRKFSLLKSVKYLLLSRLVKLFKSAHGNGWFGWPRFIEYALTTPFSFQVSPYPT